MIRPLRQRHRLMVIALAVVLPIAFVAGVASRKPVPVADTLAFPANEAVMKFDSVLWERADLWTKREIRTRLLADGAGRFAVALSLAKEIQKPDVLLYWAPGAPAVTDKLPDDAFLIGPLGRVVLPLPATAASGSGTLILYSLADHEVVAVSQSFTTQKN